MEVSDFKIWNMPLIGKASETKFKRQRKYSIFRNSEGQKKPFTYTSKEIHTRIWRIYLGENIVLILKAIGILFVMLVVLMFISNLTFNIGLAIAIYVYASVSAILLVIVFNQIFFMCYHGICKAINNRLSNGY